MRQRWKRLWQTVQQWPRWKRFALAAILSPALVAALVTLGFYAELHRSAAAMSPEILPSFPAPTPERRLLVIAPHCDDETLGAGGLIAEARRQDIPVTVVFLTNGDAFPAACALALKKVPLRPADFVRFGEVRQKEAIAALAQLGVPENHVRFLGYPDKGMKALWESNWRPDQLFRSTYTQKDHSPYTRSFTVNTPYCGQAVVDDLTRLMEITRPTDIWVTHPADDHVDHSAAASFAQAALRRASHATPGVPTARMHYYIVHRGDWPLPQGLHPDRPLLPPAGLTQADTSWQTLPLTLSARHAKAKALACYPSQTEVSRRQLESFLRRNEIFGTLAEPTLSLQGGSATVKDASGDDVVRFVNPAVDLTKLTISRAGDALQVQVALRGNTSPGVRYTLHLRAENGTFVTRSLKAPSLAQQASPTLYCEVPLAALGLDSRKVDSDLWVGAETGVTSRLIVDQTGYRPFHLIGDTATQ